MIRGKKIVSFLFCLLLFSGCGPDADGGNEVPDTENAKAVFYNRFGFAPPDTVKGIYYYNDLFLYITRILSGMQGAAGGGGKDCEEVESDKDE